MCIASLPPIGEKSSLSLAWIRGRIFSDLIVVAMASAQLSDAESDRSANSSAAPHSHFPLSSDTRFGYGYYSDNTVGCYNGTFASSCLCLCRCDRAANVVVSVSICSTLCLESLLFLSNPVWIFFLTLFLNVALPAAFCSGGECIPTCGGLFARFSL